MMLTDNAMSLQKEVFQQPHQQAVRYAGINSYKRLLSIGNGTLLLSVAGLILTIMVAYIHHEYFSIASQIVAHIMMMLFAGTLKLGYVMRLAAFNGQRKTRMLQTCMGTGPDANGHINRSTYTKFVV